MNYDTSLKNNTTKLSDETIILTLSHFIVCTVCQTLCQFQGERFELFRKKACVIAQGTSHHISVHVVGLL